MMKKITELRENKIFKITKKVLEILIGIILVGFIVVVCLQRFSDNKISFFDYRMFTVITGSMEPVYNVGDVLVAKKVEPSTIKVGDDITYEGLSGSFNDKVITHRVVRIEKDSNNKYVFHTKGIPNLVEDLVPVSESQIYGIIIYKSLLLSTIYRIVATNIGFYLFIIIPILYVIGSEIITVMLDKEEKRREKLRNKM